MNFNKTSVLKGNIGDYASFDDIGARGNFKRILALDQRFQYEFMKFFNITSITENIKIVNNFEGNVQPLPGEENPYYGADLAVVRDGIKIGIIEVDEYFKWGFEKDKNGKPYCLGWPRNYKYCHALRSKLKYFAPDVRGETVLDERNVNLNPDKLPYMFSTQNMLGTKALVGTDKLIMKYIDNMVELPTHGIPTHGNSGEFLGMQCFIRIPLQEAWKFGAWEEGE
tara:strand:- start:105 stop:779 length:675 start_codon:yes stop_codon:yes gene_type:complete